MRCGRPCFGERRAPIWSRPLEAWDAASAAAPFAQALPNLYADPEGHDTRLTLFVPADGDNFVRSVSVVRAERWARRVADRFPPALLNCYLDAIGVPPLDEPAWGPGGTVLTRRAAPSENPIAQTIAELHERMYGDR